MPVLTVERTRDIRLPCTVPCINAVYNFYIVFFMQIHYDKVKVWTLAIAPLT